MKFIAQTVRFRVICQFWENQVSFEILKFWLFYRFSEDFDRRLNYKQVLKNTICCSNSQFLSYLSILSNQVTLEMLKFRIFYCFFANFNKRLNYQQTLNDKIFKYSILNYLPIYKERLLRPHVNNK